MTYKLLFVCLGNICRSPSAENIMNHLIQEAGLTDKIVCDSAGTSGYHVGAAPDRRMNIAANKQGIELQGKSRKFIPSDLQQFDLILAMDRENYQDILYLDREGKYEDKVYLMCDFATSKPDREVPDPYYGGQDGFDYVIDLLFDACSGLLDSVVKSDKYQTKIEAKN
ncbi:MAG: low molecular weight protein-tyrosine-phosphatase [Cyanobacteria bacterium P01_G01_bin.19]